jgi:hypothetical protein
MQSKLLVEILAVTTRSQAVCDLPSDDGVDDSKDQAHTSKIPPSTSGEPLETFAQSEKFTPWLHCATPCTCECHISTAARRNEGGLVAFARRSLLPSSDPCVLRCRSCNSRQSRTVLSFEYNLPRWIANRVICFKASFSPLDGIGISLRLPVLLENNAPWGMLWRGEDAAAVKLVSRLCYSPMDYNVYDNSLFMVSYM